VSNTVRQVAGALGVAVLGSVLSAVYRDHVATSLADLPAPARAAAEESISGAYAAAAQLGPAAPRLIAAANDAFVSAMHWAAAVSALVAALGVVIVLRWMPGRPVPAPADARPAAEPELAGTA